MMFDTQAFIGGAGQFLLAFGMAAIVLIVFKFLYQFATPYNELKLIREGCTPAAVTLSGAMIGFAIPVAMALSQAVSPAEFIAWAVLAGVIQIVAFLIVRALVIKDLAARIERGELSIGIYLAAISITVGLLNAASMTE
jgi:putative membrane protein